MEKKIVIDIYGVIYRLNEEQIVTMKLKIFLAQTGILPDRQSYLISRGEFVDGAEIIPWSKNLHVDEIKIR